MTLVETSVFGVCADCFGGVLSWLVLHSKFVGLWDVCAIACLLLRTSFCWVLSGLTRCTRRTSHSNRSCGIMLRFVLSLALLIIVNTAVKLPMGWTCFLIYNLCTRC